MRRNVASQVVGAQMVSATDGSAFTGSVTCSVTGDGGTQATGSVSSGACTHEGNGFHTYAPAQAETDYAHVAYTFTGSGAIPVTVQVYPMSYDSSGVISANVTQFGGSAGTFASGIPAVNATQISGDSTAADNLETAFDNTAGSVPHMGIIDQGTAQSATSTTLVLRSAAAFADDEIIGATIVITGGSTGVGQSRLITDYVSSTDTATVETWTTTPTGTITYKIYGTAPSSSGSGLDAAGVRAAIGLSSANLDTRLSTIDSNVDAILVDTGTTLDGKIDAIDNFIDTEIATLTTNLATVDTVVDAIKAKTDNLTFTVAGQVDANVESMNATEVLGTGTSADPWNGE